MKQLLQHAARMLLLMLRTTTSVNHHLDSTSRQTGTREQKAGSQGSSGMGGVDIAEALTVWSVQQPCDTPLGGYGYGWDAPRMHSEDVYSCYVVCNHAAASKRACLRLRVPTVCIMVCLWQALLGFVHSSVFFSWFGWVDSFHRFLVPHFANQSPAWFC